MTEEVHRVREATLRALEPEIRKLTRNQQDDAKKIQTEADSEVSLLKVELDAEKRKKLAECQHQSEADIAAYKSRKQASFMQLHSDANKNHQDNMTKLKERLQADKDIQLERQKDDFAKMDKKHAESMEKLRTELDEHNRLLERKLQYDREVFQQKLDTEHKKQLSLYSQEEKDWETDMKEKLLSSHEIEIQNAQDEIEKKRDEQIDVYIRRMHDEESALDVKLQKDSDVAIASIKAQYEKKMSIIRQSILHLRESAVGNISPHKDKTDLKNKLKCKLKKQQADICEMRDKLDQKKKNLIDLREKFKRDRLHITETNSVSKEDISSKINFFDESIRREVSTFNLELR